MSSSVTQNRNGWDGKLRLTELNGDGESDASSEAENPSSVQGEEDSHGARAPRHAVVQQGQAVEGQEIKADEDLLQEYGEGAEDIELSHCKISSLESLGLEKLTKATRLGFRQNLINIIQIPESLKHTLLELDFYDNLIKDISGLDYFDKLKSLDLSFNKIKHIRNISHLKDLRDLYFVQNRISAIDGVDGLVNLRNLELGGNRIRIVQNLDNLVSLEELWLGKNKITEIAGLASLVNLTILSIQANRISEINGLDALIALQELHISHNALTKLSGLDNNINLRIIDISNNPISKLEGLENLAKLEEFWSSSCKLESFEEVEKQLKGKQQLKTVYFEGNPLQLKQPALYRNKIRLALPQVQQIDATYLANASIK